MVIQHQVIIVGAGIAGCTIAGELTRAGIQVLVMDQQSQPALETSAHATALAHPQVGQKKSKLQRFTQLAHQIAIHQWQPAQVYRSVFEPLRNLKGAQIGQLQELVHEMGYDAQAVRLVTEEEGKKRANVQAPGIWYETAAVFSLPNICHQEIATLTDGQQSWQTKVKYLRYFQELWHAFAEDDVLIGRAPVIILANGLGVKDLLKTIDYELFLRPVRGQLSQFLIKKDTHLAALLPKVTVRGDGYCLPPSSMSADYWSWEVGSSYDEDQTEKAHWGKSDADNLNKAFTIIGCEQSHINEAKAHASFVGIRSASKDRLPLIGPVGQFKGLFIATAFGSRGVLWSALAAPMIRAYVEAFFAGADRLRAGFFSGADVALTAEIVSAVSPARFFAGALATRASNSKPTLPDS